MDTKGDLDAVREEAAISQQRASGAMTEMARLGDLQEAARKADDERRAADDDRRVADDDRRAADDGRRAADDERRTVNDKEHADAKEKEQEGN
jgi:colicin import membrane protein